jgi:hypothetical protein
LLLVRERHEFNHLTFISNMLEPVPVAWDEERQIVLKALNYFEDGRTAVDTFHAVTAETRPHVILGSNTCKEIVGPERIQLEPDSE